MRWGRAALFVLAVAGCRNHAPVATHAAAHYVVGPAWRSAGGAWFYPQERFAGSSTGLSDVLNASARQSAADGEVFDATLPEAAVQDLQLPVILRVTDLENGRSILVRAVDRGPPSPARIIGLDGRSRSLLGIGGDGPARVRLDVDTVLSQQAAQDTVGGPRLTVAAAPQTQVEEQPLGPFQAPAVGIADGSTPPVPPKSSPDAVDVDGVLRSQSVGVEPVRPTALWIDAGRFSTRSTAQAVADRIGGGVVAEGVGPRASLSVENGPYQTAVDADAALNRARAGGITGSRIVVR